MALGQASPAASRGIVTGSSILDHSAALRDPRRSRKVVHPLSKIPLTVPPGRIAGVDIVPPQAVRVVSPPMER